MTDFQLTYKQFGERGILIEWPSNIDTKTLNDIIVFKEIICEKLFKVITEINNAYNSILVIYNNKITNFNKDVSELKKLYNFNRNPTNISSKLWKIPVCYDLSFGIDSENIIRTKNMALDQLILLHSEPIYTVYFIGFLPGFLYLGGLNEALYCPRKTSPRLQIKKGSVAIGGNQTGIYPSESPGGWNIIGNSPIHLFNPANEIPCFIAGGDKIQFYPISLEEHTHILKLIEAGTYQLESEVYHD